LGRRRQKSLAGSHILVLGVAYKKNVEDTRESPAFVLIEELEARGAVTAFHDPFVPTIPHMREHAAMAGRTSAPLDAATIGAFDAVLLCTDHDGVDYDLVARSAPLVVDTRNAFRNISDRSNIVLA
jgi:UDP-N-acetyl-D-glucosamine dehydrogenase